MHLSQRMIIKIKIMFFIMALLLIMAELSPIKQFIYPGYNAKAAEIPAMVFCGDEGAEAILGILDYPDIAGRDYWSEEAIYEAGALNIVRGSGGAGGSFGRGAQLTREEALAIVFRAAGRESAAQQLGIEVNNVRAIGNRKTDPLDIMYDGYLQLAADEGLISMQNLADAFNNDQASLESGSFNRKGSAQRQEMAYWLAKALNIQPAGQQQELQNYRDWRETDIDRLPYLEAILQKGIMNGSNGRINPRDAITREQGAQIIKNAESSVLEALGYLKNFGIIENIETIGDYTGEEGIRGRNIILRGAGGELLSIVTQVPEADASGAKNENTGTASPPQKKELVVYKNGAIGDSRLLEPGDRLHFISDISSRVKFANVVSNINDVGYIAVQISYVDEVNRILDVVELFEMDYPELAKIYGDVHFSGRQNEKSSYRIAYGADVTINGTKAELADITSDATAIITIDSGNLIRQIQCVDLGINSEASRIVRGIVEENNPDLGYVTLYNEDGSGIGNTGSAMLRIYNYVDQNKTEILRNHKTANADSIETGDMAYIRLDDEGNIASISTVENYTVKYGSVISKMPSDILVEYEDGAQQLLAAGNSVIVVRDRQLVGYGALRDGDRIRLLLNENGEATDLKEITIEGDEHFITNIYKGRITKIDNISDKITVMNLQAFNRGKWERTEQKGFSTLLLSDSFKMFSNETILDIENANKLLYLNEAYIAVEENYGGEEEAVVLSYRSSSDTAVPVGSDRITGVIPGSGQFTLLGERKKVGYTPGSIVVKYGRLVSGNSLTENDMAYMALDRNYSTGEYHASVVKVDEPQIANGLAIYRGRISKINDELDFTVESFSVLEGTDWRYNNTPKTFNITFGTRILNEDGIMNVRSFKEYGEDSFLKRTVYIVADGTDAVLVSTALYGTANIRGTVYENDGSSIKLRNVRIYNPVTYMWDNDADAEIEILNNSVVIEQGKAIPGSSIKKGDSVRVLKKDANAVGDGYIIFIES